MNQNLLSRVLEFLRRKMWNKRWQRAVTCLAAVAVFGVTYALILPAITMTNVHPTLFAEELSAWSGDELTVKVTAEAEEEKPEQTFVLRTEGEGADLSASYVFNEEGICIITDEEGKEIELHRSIREDKKDVVDYWFTLEPGTKTSFTLSLTDEVDETRFAELVQAVKQDSEEKEDTVETASASDAGKSETAASVTSKNSGATASNAAKASVSNADVAEANAAAKADEEKIVTEKDDDGFEQILDGLVVNDLEVEEEESAEQTEIVAKLKVSAGLGKDYENAVKDAEKNADKRGDAEVRLSWKDVPASKASGSSLYAYVDGARITVFYDDAAGIPANAVLSVEEYEEGSAEYEEYLAQAKDAVAKATGSEAAKTVGSARFFDITILDADGNEVEPEAPVKVVISYEEAVSLKNESDLNVLHFKEEKPELFKPGATDSEDAEVKALSFTAESFSVYAIIELTDEIPEGNNLTREFENARYAVTLSFSEKAKIPENAELRVKELTKENAPEEYAENEMLLHAKDSESDILALLDIGFWIGEQEIEPEDTVYVRIKFKETAKYAAGDEVNILHRTEDKLVPVAAEALDENRETSYKVDSFSIFVITTNNSGTPIMSWTATGAGAGSAYDPEWLHRGGTERNFTADLPLGTAMIISSGRLTLANAEMTGITRSNSNTGRFCWNGSSEYFKVRTENTSGIASIDDTFSLLWRDVVVLSDGTTADLRVTGKNIKFNRTNGTYQELFNGRQLRGWTIGGNSIDMEHSVEKDGVPLKGYTLLFGAVDIDVRDEVNRQYYKLEKAPNGTIYAVECSKPTFNYYSEPISVFDVQNGKIQLARRINNVITPLYYQEGGSIGTTVTDEPAYALYKVFRGNGSYTLQGVSSGSNYPSGYRDITAEGNESMAAAGNVPYATMEPVNFAESIAVVNGALSKAYVPNVSMLHCFTDEDGSWKLNSVHMDKSMNDPDSGTAVTGFFMLMDSEKYTLRFRSGAGCGTTFVSNIYYLKIISTTGEGGNITTTDTDATGAQVTYGPGLLAVPKGKTVKYTMTPDTFYRAQTVTIWDGTQIPENRTVMPIGALLDEEGYEAVAGETYTEKTVTVKYKDESDEYGHNQTEASATFVIRKEADGSIKGYDETGTTQLFTFSSADGSCTFTDTVRNVTYPLTVNANGTREYTFATVDRNHWIDVRWERIPAAESLVIVKEWSDNGNARGTRPDTLAVHVKRESGGHLGSSQGQEGGTPAEITELITGQDPDISGSTDWVKNGDTWTYTYAIPANVDDLYIFEDAVTDYDGDHVGESGKLDVWDYIDEEDASAGTVFRIYKATVSNAVAPGVLEFTKVGEKIDSEEDENVPLAGAVFSLYTDQACLHPVTRDDGTGAEVPVTAESDADGKVTFSEVPCGMYYMKETTSPANYDSNTTLYQVQIHRAADDSTITVITPDPDGTGILIENADEGYTIVNKLARFDVIMMKVDANNYQKRLPSALFILYGAHYLDDEGDVNPDAHALSWPIEASLANDAQPGLVNRYKYANTTNTPYENSFWTSRNGTNADATSVYGKAPLGIIKTGTYYLVELDTPAGYDMPGDPISKITVDQNGVRASSRDGVTQYNVSYDATKRIYTILVPNNLGKELPHTGGPGTGLYTLGGIMLLIASALLYGFKMKREERRCS